MGKWNDEEGAESIDEFGLTERQRKFADAYVIDCNATKAVIAAGIQTNYPPQAGRDLLDIPKVMTYIKLLRSRAAEVAGVTVIRNAQELAKIAYGSAAALRSDWMNVKNWDELTDEEKSILSEVRSEVTTMYSKSGEPIVTEKLHFKVHDKLKAIEMLNKMFGFNQPDKMEHTGENGGPIKVTGMVISKGD